MIDSIDGMAGAHGWVDVWVVSVEMGAATDGRMDGGSRIEPEKIEPLRFLGV